MNVPRSLARLFVAVCDVLVAVAAAVVVVVASGAVPPSCLQRLTPVSMSRGQVLDSLRRTVLL